MVHRMRADFSPWRSKSPRGKTAVKSDPVIVNRIRHFSKPLFMYPDCFHILSPGTHSSLLISGSWRPSTTQTSTTQDASVTTVSSYLPRLLEPSYQRLFKLKLFVLCAPRLRYCLSCLRHLSFFQFLLFTFGVKGAWRPSLNISTILTSIQLLMAEPNPDDPLMADIVRLYYTLKHLEKLKLSLFVFVYLYY